MCVLAGALAEREWLLFKLRRKAFLPWAWVLVGLIAALPVFLRIEINPTESDRQAVYQVYHAWRWSHSIRNMRSGSELVFERVNEKSRFEETFFQQLQRDFKLVTISSAPRVKAFFESDNELRARIEFRPYKTSDVEGFQTVAQFPSNGILIGAWVTVSLLVMGLMYNSALWGGVGIFLIWVSGWNPLEIPSDLVRPLLRFFQEIISRIRIHDWNATEYSTLAMLSVVVWAVAYGSVGTLFEKKWIQHDRARRTAVILGLGLEVLALWAASRFGHWGDDVVWWKALLASLVQRYVLWGVLLFWFLKLSLQGRLLEFSGLTKESNGRSTRIAQDVARVLLPLLFIIGGGWAWIQSLWAGLPASSTQLILKLFWVGFLVSYITGSRVASLWILSLAAGVMLPPARGHWLAGHQWASLLDGLLLGWWISPMKGWFPVLPFGSPPRELAIISLLVWAMGTFLSAVGLPMVVCWILIFVAMWVLAQIRLESMSENEGEPWNAPT